MPVVSTKTGLIEYMQTRVWMKFQTVLLALAAFAAGGGRAADGRGAKRGHDPWNGYRSLGRGDARRNAWLPPATA